MENSSDYHSRLLKSLVEAKNAGLTRVEWLQLEGLSADAWRAAQSWFRNHGIVWPRLEGMRRPYTHRRVNGKRIAARMQPVESDVEKLVRLAGGRAKSTDDKQAPELQFVIDVQA